MNSYLPANELWQMKAHDFNRWRAENDLPVLFDYFRKTLPEFDAWLQTIGLSQHQILMTLNLGDFFNGDTERVVIKERNSYEPEKSRCIDKSDLQKPQWRTDRQFETRQLDVTSTFTPYFKWIKDRTNQKDPVMWDTLNKSYTDHFFIGGYNNIPPNSRARLWRGPELLKLGEIELPQHITMSEMNLDFADIDGLKISVSVYGGFKNISCSSFRNLEIKNTSVAFWNFKYCKFEEAYFDHSKIQDFYFTDCDLGDLSMSDCTVYALSFHRCTGLPFIQNCDLKDLVTYQPGKQNFWAEDAFRLLKNAYNSAGQKKFASEYYYQEQIAHRKNLFNAKKHHKYSSSYPSGNQSSWLDVLKHANKSRAKSLALKKLKYYWQYFSKPRYLTVLLSHKLQWAYSFLDWAIWGHGVKLHRLAFSSSTLMLLYAVLYKTLGDQISATPALGSFWDYFYFSMVTFTTLGYGDILPKTTTLRMICGSEAFLGAFMMGLVVAGFSNRKAD